MKCPNCKTEMENGFMLNYVNWVKGKRRLVAFGGEQVNAFRCPKCGKLELFSAKVK